MLARQFDWLIVLLMVPALSWAANDNPQQARRWLDRMAEANQRQSYQGTFVYRCDEQLTTMKLVHAAGADHTREKLVALNGPEQVLIQDGQSVSALAATGGQRLWARKHAPFGLFMRSGEIGNEIDRFYGAAMVGEDRIAGRVAERLKLTPTDGLRNGFALWVDKETGVVLRSDMLDSQGEVIEQVMFTQIEFISPTAAEKAVDSSSALVAPTDSPESSQTALVAHTTPTPWRIATMPPGFGVAERYVRAATETSLAQEQWVLSDGLASVSVFFERQSHSSRKPFQGATRRGALNAMGVLVAGHQVTVVGEVPMATVKMISESLQFTPN